MLSCKREPTLRRPDCFEDAASRAGSVLLAGAEAEDPEPADFEGWLLERCLEAGPLAGATRAMALEVLDEWRIALAAPSFRAWLEEGAPSDDRRPGPDGGLDRR